MPNNSSPFIADGPQSTVDSRQAMVDGRQPIVDARQSIVDSRPSTANTGQTVAELSERELIGRIQHRLAPAPEWMLVGIGDDAAVVEPERNRAEVLSVDALVEGIHFDRGFVPPDAI